MASALTSHAAQALDLFDYTLRHRHIEQDYEIQTSTSFFKVYIFHEDSGKRKESICSFHIMARQSRGHGSEFKMVGGILPTMAQNYFFTCLITWSHHFVVVKTKAFLVYVASLPAQ